MMVECKDALLIKQETDEIIAEVRFIEPLKLPFESLPWREWTTQTSLFDSYKGDKDDD
jgi:hypothetical protein